MLSGFFLFVSSNDRADPYKGYCNGRLEMMLQRFLLVMCLLGTVWPWTYFLPFFAQAGFDLSGFGASLGANLVTKGLTVDISLSIVTFWVWSFVDARQQLVGKWWLIPVATLCIGLSLALPLYLFLRERSAKAPVHQGNVG